MATPTSETEPANRPVPVLPPETSSLATSPNEKMLDSDSDSDGHGHVPSSVPRTKFTPETPATERVAMQQLQQKIDFSDQSAPSSAPSTPEHKSKKSPDEMDRSASSSRSPEESATAAAMFAPVGAGGGGDISDYSSEGEITSSVSISAILSKLDAVKSYLKEAESLRNQLQEKIGEPGILTQLGKINKMIVELRLQESSYLNIILAIMGTGKENSVPVGESIAQPSNDESDRSEREFSEEESTSGESAGGGVVGGIEGENRSSQGIVGQAVGLYREEKVDDGSDNLSLRAQLMQERQQREQEEEELRILQQKHDMLKKMLEQQRQIQELEAQQEALMRMRQQTQDQLSNAEARSLELEQMVSSVSGGGVPSAPVARSATIKPTDQQQHSQAQPEDGGKQQLLARLVDLNARKSRVEEMIALLSALKDKEGGENVEGQPPEDSRDHERRNQPASVPTVVAQAAQDLAGSSEMVDEESKTVAGASELQEKMRQAEEAKKQLSELQELITLLQDMATDLSLSEEHPSPQQQKMKQQAVGTTATQPPYPLQSKYQKEKMPANTRQQVAEEMVSMQKEFLSGNPLGITSDSSEGEEDEEEEREPALDATPPETEDGDESQEALEHSPVADYERKLAAKRREVAQLQQQRDQLMQTQRRLMELQGLIGDKQQQEQQKQKHHMLSARRDEREERRKDEREERRKDEREEGRKDEREEGRKDEREERRRDKKEEQRSEVMSSHLTSELEKQKQLYDELLRKTEQLRKLQTMLKREEKGAGVPQDGEVTPATWGGSTAPSETNSTISYDLDDTQESLEFRHTLGGSAAVEHADTTGRESGDMRFTVTRHTPRHCPPRRVLIPPEEPFPSTEKKMKLDMTATTTPGAAEPHHPTTSYSAVWPGVIFPSLPSRSKENCRDESSQTNLSATLEQAPLQEQHVTMLHQQLASTSNICGELLQGQNTLINAICQRLDNLNLETTIQSHLGHLHLYRMELEQYYQELYQAYLKVFHQPPATTATQSEQGEDPVTNGGAGEGLETAREPFEAASGAATATGAYASADEHLLTATGPQQQEEQPRQSFVEDQQQPFTQYPNAYATAFGFTPPRSSAATYSANQGQGPPPVDNSSFSFVSQSRVIPPPPPPSCGPIFPPPPPSQPWPSPMSLPYHFSPSYYGRPSFHLGQRYPYTSPSYRPFFPSPGYRWPFAPHTDYTPQFNFQPAGAAPQTDPVQYPQASFPLQTSTAVGVGTHEGGYSIGSPSGITSASVQVQAPCSPPSAMSVNLQQNSATNLTVPPHPQPGTTTYSATSTGSTLCVPTASAIGPMRGRTQFSTSYSQPPLVGYPPTAKAAPATGLSLAQRGHEATVADLQDNTVSSGAAALLGVSMQQRDKQQDTDSLSSLPLSVPEDTGPVHADIAQLSAAAQQEASADSSVFNALRDTIYSEVATLIANNEARPHFLVELFRELQLLSTDYLRQRALYSLQDLVTTFISEEGVAQGTKQLQHSWAGSASEKTPSESIVTSEDEAVPSKPPLPLNSSIGFDYVEAVHSGCSLSTPPESSLPDEPFASDNLGDTVIEVDKATSKVDETYAGGTSLSIKPPVVSLGPGGHHNSESSKSDLVQTSDLDTQVLDEQIKSIMTEVIPVLKEHLHSECSVDLLSHIRQYIMSLVLMQEKSQKQELVDVFAKQLDATLNTTLCKYLNKKLKHCGEDLLVDVSEVLFNELAFFRLMQDIRGHPDAQGQDFRSVTSGSQTTENEDEELGKASQEPTIQQPLPCTGSGAIMDEEEALGKSRDDELALAWDGHIQGSVSGEEYRGGASGSSPSSQQKEGSPLIHCDHADCSDPAINGTTTIETPSLESIEPPTPYLSTEEHVDTNASQKIAADSELSLYHLEGDGDGSQQSDSINKAEIDEQMKLQEAKESPSENPSADVASFTQVALQAQMKCEQLSTDGMAGILASIDQNQELAGDGNELPETVTHEP